MVKIKKNNIETKASFSLHKLKDISNGNEDFVTKMIQLFKTQSQVAINDLNEAYKIGNLEKISKIAHRIKPTIDNMCISELTETIRDIELNGLKYGIGNKLKECLLKMKNL